MRRAGTVVGTIGVRELVTADERFRPKGSSVADLWEDVDRLVWSTPRYSDSTRQNHKRTRELARTLPTHPSPGEALGWVESLRQAGMADATIYLHRKTMRTLYRWGMDLGLVIGNPFAIAALRRPRPSPHHIPQIAEYWPAFLAACEDARERAFLGVLRFLAVRREEALGFQRRDFVHEPRGWVAHVRRARPDPGKLEGRPLKTESSYRVLPIPPVLRELLEPVLGTDPEIRRGRGGGRLAVVPWIFPYGDNHLAKMADRIRAAAPLAFRPGKFWHSFRDTTAAEVFEAGAELGGVRDILGHTSEATTRDHYLGIIGRRVKSSAFDGVWQGTEHRSGAPPGEATPRPAATGRGVSPDQTMVTDGGDERWTGTKETKRRTGRDALLSVSRKGQKSTGRGKRGNADGQAGQLSLPTGLVVATRKPGRP